MSLNGERSFFFPPPPPFFFKVEGEGGGNFKKRRKKGLTLFLLLPLLSFPPPPKQNRLHTTASASLADLLDGIRVKFAKELGISQRTSSPSRGRRRRGAKRDDQNRLEGPPGRLPGRPQGRVGRARARPRPTGCAPAPPGAAGGAAAATLRRPGAAPLRRLVRRRGSGAPGRGARPGAGPTGCARWSSSGSSGRCSRRRRGRPRPRQEEGARRGRRGRGRRAGGAVSLPRPPSKAWVLDFAALFRDKLGVDPEGPGLPGLWLGLAPVCARGSRRSTTPPVPSSKRRATASASLQRRRCCSGERLHAHLAHRALVKGYYTCEAAKGQRRQGQEAAREAAAKEADRHYKTAAAKYPRPKASAAASTTRTRPSRTWNWSAPSSPPGWSHRRRRSSSSRGRRRRRAGRGPGRGRGRCAAQARERAAAEAVNVALHAAMRAALSQNSLRNAEGNMKRAWQ